MAQHSFWIIVDGETPTSFRSRQREDLLPTLHQLQRKQPQVKLLWFERGRLWASPTEARESLIARRKMPTGRGRQWRPGGEHVDPRAKYEISRDQKRARFKARLGYDRSPPETPDDRGRDPDPSDASQAAGVFGSTVATGRVASAISSQSAPINIEPQADWWAIESPVI